MTDIRELIELLYEENQFGGLKLMLMNGENKRVWVAEKDNGCIIGMCTLQVLISTAEGGEVGLVEDVVVKKHFRCRGIGRQLLQEMKSWATTRGLRRLQLLTDKTNLASIRFYQNMNWQSTQLICMRKLIKQT